MQYRITETFRTKVMAIFQIQLIASALKLQYVNLGFKMPEQPIHDFKMLCLRLTICLHRRNSDL